MAKEIIRLASGFPNKKLLEDSRGVIEVKSKVEFRTESEKSPCNNCGNLHSSKTIYQISDNENVGVCYFCNDKVHNPNTTNPRFRKEDVFNQNKKAI